MRISDWSSDVCSSDLSLGCQTFHIACSAYADQRVRCAEVTRAPHTCRVNDRSAIIGPTSRYESPATSGLPPPAMAASAPARSEEHTSELQSLMRISYAVFCLKKKKKNALKRYPDALEKN